MLNCRNSLLLAAGAGLAAGLGSGSDLAGFSGLADFSRSTVVGISKYCPKILRPVKYDSICH